MARAHDDPTRARECIALLGIDHAEFGRVVTRHQAERRTACAISCGGAGVQVRKADTAIRNEDACGAVDEHDRTLLVVTDSHAGHHAGHALCEGVLALPIPRDPLALLGAIAALADERNPPPDASATTLLVAVWSRESGRGFGVSYGDSSLVVLGRTAPAVLATRKNTRYVTPAEAHTLAPQLANEFEFVIPPDGIAVAFTDGVDECCYRTPDLSIRPHHLQALVAAGSGPIDVEEFVTSLATLALTGVDGYPGGQDNIAIAAMR